MREQLTGPGGPFEVVTEVVDGIEMKVYKDRMPSLREVAEAAIRRGDEDLHRLRRAPHRLRRVRAPANAVAPALAETPASATATGWPCSRPTTPSGAWRSGPRSTSGRSSSGLNGWWKTDEILYGLEDSGAKVLVADAEPLRAHRRRSSTSLPASSTSYLIDVDPADVGDRPACCTASTS